MGALNRPGQEERLEHIQKQFRHASPKRTRAAIQRQLRDIGGALGFIALGVFVGGCAFIALDLLNPPAQRSAMLQQGAYYQTCREAFQDGRANIRRGEPGYRVELDADNDGMACEPYLRR